MHVLLVWPIEAMCRDSRIFSRNKKNFSLKEVFSPHRLLAEAVKAVEEIFSPLSSCI
jgi:hypothetical protein